MPRTAPQTSQPDRFSRAHTARRRRSVLASLSLSASLGIASTLAIPTGIAYAGDAQGTVSQPTESIPGSNDPHLMDTAPGDTTEPGTLTKVEPLNPAIAVPHAGASYRITYWTVNSQGQPALSTAAVYLPQGKAPEGGWPVMAWAHGTVGLNDVCAYSTNGPAAWERDWDYLNSWMDQGYAIVASDYVGLGTPGSHPYLDGKVEAHSVVDAIKASTTHFEELAKKWFVAGQSQGGGAAMFTARYAEEYGGNSDGLSYRGAVATGVPAYIEDLLPVVFRPGVVPPGKLDEQNALPTLTTYLLYIVSGLRTAHPEWDVNSYLTDYGKKWVDYAEGPICDTLSTPSHPAPEGITDVVKKENIRIEEVFSKPLDTIPGFKQALKDYMGIPESGYNQPVFIGQGGLDTDIFMPGAVTLAEKMKASGQPVTFKFYPDKDHSGTVNKSKEDSIPFVKNVMS
ncbi:alpha/beta hydrolase family protein [Corynebacterium sp. SFY-K9]|uniref:alpha/beta hydrolase family protein n=1 Tax=Corynebacterium sp. SFY-K9 TaxID=3092263 RepID=UPI00298F3A78|nr:lipase family protein [Corynebacterium sp. SFY-K9]